MLVLIPIWTETEIGFAMPIQHWLPHRKVNTESILKSNVPRQSWTYLCEFPCDTDGPAEAVVTDDQRFNSPANKMA